MANSRKWRSAEKFFNDGNSFYQQNRFSEALTELLKAEKAFRSLDSRGHPWGHPLPNGISGLANSLFLLGRCYQELGRYHEAVTCYETSRINSKFEQRRAFRSFQLEMQKHLAACYEQELSAIGPEALQAILAQDADIDTSFLFPFSLEDNPRIIARLYELEPSRHARFSEFYLQSKNRDAAIRRKAGKDLDETRMKRATFWIWTTFGLLWIIYSMIMVKALFLE